MPRLEGGSYQIVTSEHMLEIQNLLRTSLGQPKVTELKNKCGLVRRNQ